MTTTRKRPCITKITNRRKQEGGKGGKGAKTRKMKLFNGILYSIKFSIAQRISKLLNSQITRRIEDAFLKDLPPLLAARLRGEIDEVSIVMMSDLAKKSMDVGENMLKAVPGFGNAVSLVAAVDKGLAAMKNARTSVERIGREVEQIKLQLRQMGMDPDTQFPILNKVPHIPQIPVLDKMEKFFDSASDAPGMDMTPSIPSISVPMMPEMPNMPTVPTIPTVPNMNQMGDLSKAAAMSKLGNANLPTKMPGRPTIPTLGKLQKGGGDSCDRIISRTKMSLDNFHNNSVHRLRI